MCKKDFEKIADEILCGVDYDIYKDDCNEMDNELRDEIEARLVHEFDCFDEMYAMLEKVLTEYKEMLGMSPEVEDIERLLAKARGEHA